MMDAELLLILGLGGFVAYALYKAKTVGVPAATQYAADLYAAAQQAGTNLLNAQASVISPGLQMFSIGSGTTPNGNQWTATSGAVLIVNGMQVGLSDRIGPGGQTAQTLLQEDWTNDDIADYIAMSRTPTVQALQQAAASGYQQPSVITWNPGNQ